MKDICCSKLQSTEIFHFKIKRLPPPKVRSSSGVMNGRTPNNRININAWMLTSIVTLLYPSKHILVITCLNLRTQFNYTVVNFRNSRRENQLIHRHSFKLLYHNINILSYVKVTRPEFIHRNGLKFRFNQLTLSWFLAFWNMSLQPWA